MRANNNSSVDALRLLLDVGGAKQLHTENDEGSLFIQVKLRATQQQRRCAGLAAELDVGGPIGRTESDDGSLPIHCERTTTAALMCFGSCLTLAEPINYRQRTSTESCRYMRLRMRTAASMCFGSCLMRRQSLAHVDVDGIANTCGCERQKQRRCASAAA